MKKTLVILFLLLNGAYAYAAPSDTDRQKAINDALTDVETNGSSIHKNSERILNSTEPKQAPSTHKRNFELAFQTDSYNYTTGDKWPYYYSKKYTTSDKIKRNGTLNGLFASTSWYGPLHTFNDFWGGGEIPNFARLEAELSDGKSSYSSYVSGKLRGISSWNFDARLLIGYDYALTHATDLTLYIGGAYQRYSHRDGGWVDFIVNDFARYTTITNQYYLPIGAETHTALNEDWDVNVKLEGDIVLAGNVAYHLNDITGTFQGTDLGTGQIVTITPKEANSSLNGGFGIRTSLKIIRKYKYCDFYIEPFLKFLYLNQSEKVQARFLGTNGKTYVSANPDGSPNKALWDAKNTTIDLGARAGVQF